MIGTTKIKQNVQESIELGNKFKREGKLKEAVSIYQEAIKFHRNSYELYHFLGEALAAKNDLETAVDAYRKSIEINPEFVWSHHCLGQTFFWRGKLDQAINCARQTLKIEPERAVFHFQLGLYLESKLEFDSSIAAYSQALELEPEYEEARQHLAAVLARQLEKLISQGKDLIEKGDLEGAIAVFQQGIELSADSYECHHFLGEALVKKNELAKAEDCFRQSIKLNPEYYWSYHNLGQILLWQSRLDEALINYRHAVKINPAAPNIVYSRLTDLLLGKYKADEAHDLCRFALNYDSKSAELHFNLGKVLAAKQLWQDAASSYSKAVELKSNYWDAYQNLGDILVKLHRMEEAQQAYQNAETAFYNFQDFSRSDIPDDFDWQIYLKLNPDLKITSKFEAISHFMLHGIAEDRLYALKNYHDPNKKPDIAPQSVIPEVNFPLFSKSNKSLKLAVLVHIYYFDLWPEIKSRLRNIESEFDLYINIVASIWLPQMNEQIREDFPQAKILISPNRGKDIGGHLFLSAYLDFSRYDLLCLLHTKKSPHIDPAVSDLWRQDLLDAILGSKEKVQANLAIMNQYSHIGLIGSRYWRDTSLKSNGENYQYLLDKFGIKSTAQNCEYVSGTMMLIRPQIIQIIYEKLQDVELESGDDKELDFHIDGQMAHALERIIGNIVRDQGFDFFWQE